MLDGQKLKGTQTQDYNKITVNEIRVKDQNV